MVRTLMTFLATAVVVLVVFLGLGPTQAQAVPGQKYDPRVNVPMAQWPIRAIVIERNGSVFLFHSKAADAGVWRNNGFSGSTTRPARRFTGGCPMGSFG
jgi:hypothetical protein